MNRNSRDEMDWLGQCRFELARRQFRLDVEFNIPARGITGIFGSSGGGKTTLLRCIAGLEREARGRLTIDDQVWHDDAAKIFVPPHERHIGYVFQEARLFPHLSVAANLAYGQRRSRQKTRSAIGFEEAIELLDLAALLERKPSELSGGESQRVAIGRALLRARSAVLMDEPLASLDAARKREILPFLDRLHAELSIPILYVSHDLDEITRLCDHLVTMESGRVLASGELSDVLNEPSSVLLTDALRGCVLNGRVESYDNDYDLCKVNVDGMVLTVVGGKRELGTAVRLRVLARDVSLARAAPEETTILNVIPVRVEAIPVTTEAYVQVALSCGANQLMAQVTRRSCDELGLRVGEHVFAQIKAVAVKTVAEGSW